MIKICEFANLNGRVIVEIVISRQLTDAKIKNFTAKGLCVNIMDQRQVNNSGSGNRREGPT